MKQVSERDDKDLLNLICELSGRLALHDTKPIHDALVEACNEMGNRLEEYASKGMRWVKASERLPEEIGKKYFIKTTRGESTATTNYNNKKEKRVLFIGHYPNSSHYIIDNVIEWLEESPDKENEPVADQLSIDELLSEFKRQGFDTSNWDGDEGAEKAIVDGVVNSIHAQSDRIKELEAENEILKMENSHSKLVVDEAKREIERLRGLVSRIIPFAELLSSRDVPGDMDLSPYDEIKEFKANNNL